MRKIFWLALCGLLMTNISIEAAAEESSDIVLSCKATVSLKHFDTNKEIDIFIEIYNAAEKLEIVRSEKVNQLDENGNYDQTFFKIDIETYNIIEHGRVHILFRRDDLKRENQIIFATDDKNMLTEVEVMEDDAALGTLNRFNGNLNIVTTFFERLENKYRYGWHMEGNCERASAKF